MLLFNTLWVSLVINTCPLKLVRIPASNPGHSAVGCIQGPRAFSSRFSSNNDDASPMTPSYLILSVGGFQYKINRKFLVAFPESLFETMMNSEWNEASDAVVEIQRSGELFKFVYEYMFYGQLPRNEFGISLLGDASLLKEIKQEAEFYQLPGLVAECEGLLNTCEAEQRIKPYAAVVAEIEKAKSTLLRRYNVVYKKGGPDSLIALLRSNPYAPAWVAGTLHIDCNPKIFKSTTVKNVNIAELLAAAVPSPFGRGTKTVFDKQVRDSMEIPASELCDLTEIVKGIDISSLAPNMKLSLKPYKLVLYQEGGHFDNHRDTVRNVRHIGTLVLILNSEYTGGELEVCHGQQKLEVTGAWKWVAMYGDCVHTIRPVTSGTRVSLIFDIWNESDELPLSYSSKILQEGVDDEHNGEDGYDDSDYGQEEYDEYFWQGWKVNTAFWLSKGGATEPSRITSMVTPTLGMDEVWSRIYASLDKELEKYATVSICLEHLYPACQANPDFLKGEDAILYQMLRDKYSLGVTAIALARSKADHFHAIGYSELGSDKLLEPDRNVLFIPNIMNTNSLLYHMPWAENTGNQQQAQELVYLVAVLIVRKP